MKRERLTKKVELPFDYSYAPKCECIEMGSTVTFWQVLAYDGVCSKLGKTEDILEKYGIESLYELDKKLRLLELIKAKHVNVYNFTFYVKHREHFDYEHYSEIFDLPENECCCDTLEVQQFTDGTKLTEENFYLLKEGLL